MSAVVGSTLGLRAIESQIPGHSGRVGHGFSFMAWASSSTRVWLVTPASSAPPLSQHPLQAEQIVDQFCGCVDVQASSS